jgi:ABC-type branched-subunit amino acid transport system ATPase component
VNKLSAWYGAAQALFDVSLQVGEGELVVLDELCEGIAPVLVEAIVDALLQLKRQGMAMLIAEQNALLSIHADRVITLVAGHIGAPLTP